MRYRSRYHLVISGLERGKADALLVDGSTRYCFPGLSLRWPGDAFADRSLLRGLGALIDVLLPVDLYLGLVDLALGRLIEHSARSQHVGLHLTAWCGAGADVDSRWIDALLRPQVSTRVHGALGCGQLPIDLTSGVLTDQTQACIRLVLHSERDVIQAGAAFVVHAGGQ